MSKLPYSPMTLRLLPAASTRSIAGSRKGVAVFPMRTLRRCSVSKRLIRLVREEKRQYSALTR